ncbi:hypothetical protein NEOKW01_0042 [Nematocida sp. AWRm80]|nr:hypothetical protein NEOKW01_0042 [Nematocida sp. AWRm80]
MQADRPPLELISTPRPEGSPKLVPQIPNPPPKRLPLHSGEAPDPIIGPGPPKREGMAPVPIRGSLVPEGIAPVPIKGESVLEGIAPDPIIGPGPPTREGMAPVPISGSLVPEGMAPPPIIGPGPPRREGMAPVPIEGKVEQPPKPPSIGPIPPNSPIPRPPIIGPTPPIPRPPMPNPQEPPKEGELCCGPSLDIKYSSIWLYPTDSFRLSRLVSALLNSLQTLKVPLIGAGCVSTANGLIALSQISKHSVPAVLIPGILKSLTH